jgi:hypothetical protein
MFCPASGVENRFVGHKIPGRAFSFGFVAFVGVILLILLLLLLLFEAPPSYVMYVVAILGLMGIGGGMRCEVRGHWWREV